MITSQVGFFYNKDLFAKAGVDASAIKTWDDLLAAVKKLKAAGITPIVVGGADKWPLHFYWTHLAVRIGGKPAFEAAHARRGRRLRRRDLRERRRAVQAARRPQALPDRLPRRHLSAVGRPVRRRQGRDDADAQLACSTRRRRTRPTRSASPTTSSAGSPSRPCPAARATPDDTLGGINGWLVTKGAPKEAVEFLKFFIDAQNQRIAAERGYLHPGRQGRRRRSSSGRSCKHAGAPTSRARSTTRTSTTRCSARRWARSSTTSRPRSPPAAMTPKDAANTVQEAWKQATELADELSAVAAARRRSRTEIPPGVPARVSPRQDTARWPRLQLDRCGTAIGALRRGAAVPAAGAAPVHAVRRVCRWARRPGTACFNWNGFGSPTEFVGLRNFSASVRDAGLPHRARQQPADHRASRCWSSCRWRWRWRCCWPTGSAAPTRFRLIFFLPYVLAEIAAGPDLALRLRRRLRPAGQALDRCSAPRRRMCWPSRDLAMYAILVVVVWKYFGFHMMLYIAGLQQIDRRRCTRPPASTARRALADLRLRHGAAARIDDPAVGVLRHPRLAPAVRPDHAADQGRPVRQHADDGELPLHLRRHAHATSASAAPSASSCSSSA